MERVRSVMQGRWQLAVCASVVLHASIAGGLQQGWLSLGGGGLGGRGGSGGVGAEEMYVPLELGAASGEGKGSELEASERAEKAAELASVQAPAEAQLSGQAAMEVKSEKVEEKIDEEEPANLLKIGIDDGDKDAEDWLGAAQASPHSARLSSVNQPAWSVTAGSAAALAQQASGEAGGVKAAPVSQATVSEQKNAAEGRVEAAKPKATAAAAAANAAAAKPLAKDAAGREANAREASDLRALAPGEGEVLGMQPKAPAVVDEVKREPQPVSVLDLQPEAARDERAVVQNPAAEQIEAAGVAREPDAQNAAARDGADATPASAVSASASNPSTSPSATSANTSGAGNAGAAGAATTTSTGGAPGDTAAEKSDAESMASSTVPSLTFQPGRPLAAEGVRIRTVVPRFSITAQVASRPKNPMLELTFNRDGKVIAGKFVEGRNTGYEDIDGPILDSAMRWTATGKKLQQLTAGDPKATFTVRVTYLLQ